MGRSRFSRTLGDRGRHGARIGIRGKNLQAHAIPKMMGAK